MKNCLICQSGADEVSLIRLPVSLEGNPLGDFLVCSECFDLLGQDKVAALVRSAALEGAYQPNHVLTPEAQVPEMPEEAPRSLETEVPESALTDPAALGQWVGAHLAPLLMGQYRQGRGQVTLLTSLTQDETGFHFRAVLGD